MWGFSPCKRINRNKVDRHFWKRGYCLGWGFLDLSLFESMDNGFNPNAFLGFQLYRYTCYISVDPQRL